MNTISYKSYYAADIVRNGGKRKGGFILRFLKYLRKSQFCNNSILLIYYKWKLKRYRLRFGLEVPPETKIGKGLYIGHPYNITINPHAILGDYCNIHKGVLVGAENRGKRKGCPHIGNRVWIGINAAIVGNITIGDDVLIAPNSYVNCDIPSHSIVFGNPCIVKHCDHATLDYINNAE